MSLLGVSKIVGQCLGCVFISGWCLEGFWKMFGYCLDGGWCEKGYWKVFQSDLDGVLPVSWWWIKVIWKVFVGCEEGVITALRYLEVWLWMWSVGIGCSMGGVKKIDTQILVKFPMGSWKKLPISIYNIWNLEKCLNSKRLLDPIQKERVMYLLSYQFKNRYN